MIKNNKKILMSVLSIGIGISIIGCSGGSDLKEIVELEEQKSIIDEALTVKSLVNLNNFEGDRWLKNGNILGVKDQPSKKSLDSQAKISVYDVENDNFIDYVEGKSKEWLFLGETSEEEDKLLYLSLVNGDFKRNIYDFNVLDLKNKSTENILNGISSTTDMVDNYIYIGKDMNLYRYNFDEGLEEISLPKGLIEELKDFTNYDFEDYLDMYYKNELVEGERREKIKEQFEYSKEYNDIEVVSNLSDEVIVRSSNGKSFLFNISDKVYTSEDDIEYEIAEENTKEERKQRIEREFKEDGSKVLWKIGENGEKEKKIEEFSKLSYYNIRLSPDETKIVYNSSNDDESKSSYIYDLDDDERIKIYPEVVGRIYWDKYSEKFFITGRKFDEKNSYENITSLIRLK